MNEAVLQYDFEFVKEMPKREKSRYARMVEQFQKVKAITDEKGMIIPIELASRMAGVSRQRIDELIKLGRIERVDLDNHVYVTETSLVAFAASERLSGRPSKFVADAEKRGPLRAAITLGVEHFKDSMKKVKKNT